MDQPLLEALEWLILSKLKCIIKMKRHTPRIYRIRPPLQCSNSDESERPIG